jgi:predicted metal-dependent hydrolase
VQLDLPFLRAPHVSIAPIPGQVTAAPVAADQPPLDLPDHVAREQRYPETEYVRMRRARRYILRVRPGGGLRVTIPRGGSRAEAVRFVQRQAEWIRQERARVRSTMAPAGWHDGGAVLLAGQRVPLEIGQERGHRVARYGGRTVRIPATAPDLVPYIERDLRALARLQLGGRLRELAGVHGLSVTGISIRNQKSRWGSCSRAGRIALNFRLVQMPPEVSDYVLLHELMHLKQQNHSRRFWALVEGVCPGFRAAERWLKTEGRGLF